MTSPAGDAFRDLLQSLGEVADWLDAQPMGEQDRTEGFRHIAHLLACGLDHHLESDPERPMFTRIVSPFRKIQGDNPDAVYQWTAIDGGTAYVIRGRNVGEGYLSFTVHGLEPDDPNKERVIADVNFDSLVHGPDGTYELTVSPDDPPEGYAGNWLTGAPGRPLHRHPPLLRAARAGGGRPAPPSGAHHRAGRRSRAGAPVDRGAVRRPDRGGGGVRRLQDPGHAVARRAGSHSRSSPGSPTCFPSPTASAIRAWTCPGAVDAHYSMGPFVLGPDEALVLEGTIPECAFANVALWNRFMQTFEYRSHQTWLNRTQLEMGADGGYRVVVAHRDPGVPNWLDTEGHEIGIVFWRFFLADDRPGPITCTVVPVDEVAGLP